jgi:hypothetical protein
LRAAIPGASDTPFAFGVTSAAAEAGISDEPEFDLDLIWMLLLSHLLLKRQ